MLKLNYVEKKLLKKVNLYDFGDNNLRMNEVIARFRLKDSKEYRHYNRLATHVRQLVSCLRKLPANSEVRQKITEKLLAKLYRIGVIENKLSLESVENCGVSDFCRRRLTTILCKLKMASHMTHAVDLVTHQHIRIGNEIARDPALLVTRDKEDLIQWAEGSKYKGHIADFNDARDDFDLLNC